MRWPTRCGSPVAPSLLTWTAVGLLDAADDPRAPVDHRPPQPVADLGDLALVHAPLELVALRVLANPDHRRVDPRVRRRGPARLPGRLRIEARLLGGRDLAQGKPQLVGRRVAPVPEAAPDSVDA